MVAAIHAYVSAMKNTLIFIIALLFSIQTFAAEELKPDVIETLKKSVPGGIIEKTALTKYSGLFEIITPDRIYYTNENGSFLIAGNIIDLASHTDVTRRNWERLGDFKYSTLPLYDAIKTVRGSGARTLVTFEDPNCLYCKKLHRELQKLSNVTIYTFIVPILSENSYIKAAEIWCSDEKLRPKMWSIAMSNQENLQIENQTENCEVPFKRNIALYKKIRAVGTPAILFPSNERLSGYQTRETIERYLKPEN